MERCKAHVNALSARAVQLRNGKNVVVDEHALKLLDHGLVLVGVDDKDVRTLTRHYATQAVLGHWGVNPTMDCVSSNDLREEWCRREWSYVQLDAIADSGLIPAEEVQAIFDKVSELGKQGKCQCEQCCWNGRGDIPSEEHHVISPWYRNVDQIRCECKVCGASVKPSSPPTRPSPGRQCEWDDV